MTRRIAPSLHEKPDGFRRLGYKDTAIDQVGDGLVRIDMGGQVFWIEIGNIPSEGDWIELCSDAEHRAREEAYEQRRAQEIERRNARTQHQGATRE